MSTTGTAAEQAGQPHRPLTPAEQLAAIFAGELTADGGEIAALAKSVLHDYQVLVAATHPHPGSPPLEEACEAYAAVADFLDAQERHLYGEMPVATTTDRGGQRVELDRKHLRVLLDWIKRTDAALAETRADLHRANAMLDESGRHADRLHATLTAIRMIATEAATDDAGLLRQAILEHLGPDTAKAGA